MKRQTRPFVVEVKKRRGGLVGKRPIWAGTDLAAFAKDAAFSPEAPDQRAQLPGRYTPKDASSNTEEQDAQSHGAETIVQAKYDFDVTKSDTEKDSAAVRAEPAEGGSRRIRRRCRLHRLAVADLPRGQRWKRRLPAVLMRHKKREACASPYQRISGSVRARRIAARGS